MKYLVCNIVTLKTWDCLSGEARFWAALDERFGAGYNIYRESGSPYLSLSPSEI
jgi:hypothetical protein